MKKTLKRTLCSLLLMTCGMIAMGLGGTSKASEPSEPNIYEGTWYLASYVDRDGSGTATETNQRIKLVLHNKEFEGMAEELIPEENNLRVYKTVTYTRFVADYIDANDKQTELDIDLNRISFSPDTGEQFDPPRYRMQRRLSDIRQNTYTLYLKDNETLAMQVTYPQQEDPSQYEYIFTRTNPFAQ